MESYDEYAGELKIKGLVYSSCCPIFLYQLQNGIPGCYIQYGDELFPQIQPIKILYHPDQPNQPGHYDLLTGQFDISSAKSVIDENGGRTGVLSENKQVVFHHIICHFCTAAR